MSSTLKFSLTSSLEVFQYLYDYCVQLYKGQNVQVPKRTGSLACDRQASYIQKKSTSGMRWTVHLEGGPRRVNHAAVAIGENIYSFGGYCTGEDYQIVRPIDIHMLNTVSLRWFLLPFDDPSEQSFENVPFQRYGHTVVGFGELVYLWGGRNDNGACNVLYCFDTNTHKWSQPAVVGVIPAARDGHSSCIIQHYMYIFGGYEEVADIFSQDVFRLNLYTMTWQYIVTKGTPARWRDFHSSSAIGSKMYIFGGRGDRQGQFHSRDEVYCNRLVYLDTLTMTWVHPETKGPAPIGRRSHSAFVFQNQLYIFGGYNGLTDRHFGDLYKYNQDTNRWSVVEVKGRGPCARRRQCCCVVGGNIFLFGGTSPSPGGIVLPTPPDAEIGDSALMDHSDLYVLDTFPSLKTLCMLLVIEHQLDKSCLPKVVRWEIEAMTTNNSISRPLPTMG